MKLLLDEMLSPAIARALRDTGSDTLAVVEVPELVASSDEDLLVHATATGRTLVTMNISDFATIATRWRSQQRSHAGLVFVAARTFPQDRGFIGAVAAALAAPGLDAAVEAQRETFLRRG